MLNYSKRHYCLKVTFYVVNFCCKHLKPSALGWVVGVLENVILK